MQGLCTIINQLGRDVYYRTRDGDEIFFPWGSTLDVPTEVNFSLNIPNIWVSQVLTIPSSFNSVYMVRGVGPTGMFTPESDFGVEAGGPGKLITRNSGAISYQRYARTPFPVEGPRRIACEDGRRVEVIIEDQAAAGAGFFRIIVPGTTPGTECELIQDLSGWAKLAILLLVLVASALIVGSSLYIFQR